MNRAITFAVLVLLSLPALADGGGNVQLLRSDEGRMVGTAEYWWNKGNFSGFGFHDQLSEGSLRYFHEHDVSYSLNDYVFISGELTWQTFGDAQKIGVGLHASELFGDGLNPFYYLNITRYMEAWGADVRQTEVAWLTKSLPLGENVSVYLSGFANFRTGAPDVAQPQIWFTFGDSKLEFGAELDMFGDSRTPQFALKYTF